MAITRLGYAAALVIKRLHRTTHQSCLQCEKQEIYAWLTRGGGLTMARVGYSAPRRHACECDDEHGCVVLHSCIRLARTIRRNFHDFRYILKHIIGRFTRATL